VIYQDLNINNELIRVFTESIDPIELKWHRDDEDRMIWSISKTDWLIQLEDKLPQELTIPIFIERGKWHRLIKGSGDLTLKIIKSGDE
jgi:hypothetical protein